MDPDSPKYASAEAWMERFETLVILGGAIYSFFEDGGLPAADEHF